MSTSMFDEYDIFKTMHPVKLQVMKELAENMQGKSIIYLFHRKNRKCCLRF